MAPKAKRAAAKAKGKALAAPAAPAAKAVAKASSANPLSQSAKKRRQLERRTTNDQADRAVQSHCPLVPESMLLSAVDPQTGLAAKEYIKASIRQARADNSRLCASFWRDFHRRFGFDGIGVLDVMVANQDEVLGGDILQAFEQAQHSSPCQRSSNALLQLLRFRPQWNQRELVGLFRLLGRLSSQQLLNRGGILDLWMETLKMVARIGKLTEWNAEMTAATGRFEEALQKNWQESKGREIPPKNWIMGLQVELTVWCRKQDIDLLCQDAAGPHLDLAAARCARQLPFFHDVLQSVIVQASGTGFRESLKQDLDKLVNQAAHAVYVKVKDDCAEKATRELAKDPRMTLTLKFQWILDLQLEMPSLDPHSAWAYMHHGKCKLLLLNSKPSFPRFPWEQWLLPALETDADLHVPATDLAKYKAGRSTALELIKERGGVVKDLHCMLAALRKDIKVLTCLDSTIEVDILWAEMHAATATIKLGQERLLAVLPTADKKVSLAQAAAALQTKERDDMFKLGPAALRDDLKSCLLIVKGLEAHSGPKIASNASAFSVLFLARCSFFFEDGEAQASEIKTGQAAIERVFGRFDRQVTAERRIPSLGSLQHLQAYRWVLNGPQQNTISEWLKAATVEASASTGRRSRGGAAPAGQNVDSLMSLFN